MKCEDVDRLIIDYLDKNLDNETIFRIENHLSSCERCLDEVKEMKELLTAMAENKEVTPNESLRINFYHTLHCEMNRNGSASDENPKVRSKSLHIKRWYGIAAGLALILSGAFTGMFIHTFITNSVERKEISQLRSEVSDLKRSAMMAMIQQESSSDRIHAVRYADQFDTPDQGVIDVLINTLNNDRNLNVRIAAGYALEKYADQPSVCDSLVKSLALQTDPIMQVTLINILAQRKVKSAFVPIQRIIDNRKTIEEVRAVAENSLKVLI
jgi:hypothetical protein